ncbi:probable methyltransferase TARBP1 [Schistocerca piceifrons]|uniref:probable methyltransferase TARBP1 n=1 Tax=Schistocerca piceifrons TaxID=274613 RepID=UPI001F5EE0C9|nr:probable methyltransferase TARBP1 [Schistocerca piceifrons]
MADTGFRDCCSTNLILLIEKLCPETAKSVFTDFLRYSRSYLCSQNVFKPSDSCKKHLGLLATVLKIALTEPNREEHIHFSNDDIEVFQSIITKCNTILETEEENFELKPVVIDVLSYCLVLLPDDKIIAHVYEMLLFCENKLSFSASESDFGDISMPGNFLIALYLLEAIIQILYILEQNCLPNREKMKDKFLSDFSIHMLVVRLLTNSSYAVVVHILNCIVPKLLKFVNSVDLLKQVWTQLSIKYCSAASVDSHLSVPFLILCSLSNMYLPCSESTDSYSLTQYSDFWKLCQIGLMHSDLSVRKQALYLTKRAVDITFQRDNCNSENLPESLVWRSCQMRSDFLKLWHDLFLILETLEEKQVHLIKPVLPMIQRLSTGTSEWHKSWTLCIFQRLLKHDNNTVVKWGVTHFINLNLVYFTALGDICTNMLFVNFMDAINNTALYATRDSTLKLSDTVESLVTLFHAICQLHIKNCRLYFGKFIEELTKRSWGPVPMFYITKALASSPITPVWSDTHLLLCGKLARSAIVNQNVYIRAAIECSLLECAIKFADRKLITVKSVCHFLNSFSSKLSLKRGTFIWNEIVNWLKSFITKSDAQDFVIKFAFTFVDNMTLSEEQQTDISVKAFGRMVVLLLESECLTSAEVKGNSGDIVAEVFRNTWKRLCNIDSNGDDLQAISISLLATMLEECVSIKVDPNDSVRTTLAEIFQGTVHDIFLLISKKITNLLGLQDIQIVNNYLLALKAFSEDQNILPLIEQHVYLLHNAVLQIYERKAKIGSSLNILFAMKVIEWVSSCLRNHMSCSHNDSKNEIMYKQCLFIESLVRSGELDIPIYKRFDEITEASNLRLRGKLACEYTSALWSTVSLCTEISHQTNLYVSPFKFVDKSLLETAINAIEIGGRGVCIPVMNTMRIIFHYWYDKEILCDIGRFLSICWMNIFEMRWTEYFWGTTEVFMKLTFHPSFLQERRMHPYILQYAQQIMELGESMSGVCSLLMLTIQNVNQDHKLNFVDVLSEILLEALLYGPSHRRDLRAENDTCKYIRSLEEDTVLNRIRRKPCISDGEVRARALQILLDLCSVRQDILIQIVEMLLQKDKCQLQKARYFSDSHHHRLKNRLMQVLLVLEPYLSYDADLKLASWLYESLHKENHQPSVRHQQEWLLVKILFRHRKLIDDMWLKLKEACEKRTGSLCSFIAVVMFLAQTLDDKLDKENFVDKSMSEIFPFCMGQHFSVRLYAQVALKKLWDLSRKHNFSKVLQKYQVMQSCLEVSLSQANAVKNVHKLVNDFWFGVFHPVQHYTFETIFYDLPRLSSICSDEWIAVETLKECGLDSNNTILLENADKSLKNCESISSNSGLSDQPEEDCVIEEMNNVQKKVIPWKYMLHDADSLSVFSETMLQDKKAVAQEGLIVIASLIDRAPNLGGLCRTCEVFGVAQYVIGNLKYLEDKQFQNLSVSAERWLNIIEVKSVLLPHYLLEMKRHGYIVIGAEQTSNSVKLNEYNFPKKSLVLLGNEKEGIPANLLPIMDTCVEIPQLGVIRSLNVHVTGAMFIWEYSRQWSLR